MESRADLWKDFNCASPDLTLSRWSKDPARFEWNDFAVVSHFNNGLTCSMAEVASPICDWAIVPWSQDLDSTREIHLFCRSSKQRSDRRSNDATSSPEVTMAVEHEYTFTEDPVIGNRSHDESTGRSATQFTAGQKTQQPQQLLGEQLFHSYNRYAFP